MTLGTKEKSLRDENEESLAPRQRTQHNRTKNVKSIKAV